MKIIDGTPEEIAAYRKLEADNPPEHTLAQFLSQPAEDEVAEDAETAEAEESPTDRRKILRNRRKVRYVLYSRAIYGTNTDPFETERIERFLDRAEQVLGLVPVIGKANTSWGDGYTDYIRLYPAGKRKYGAVIYLFPAAGMAYLRLGKDDVEDLLGTYVQIQPRNVAEDNVHGIKLLFSNDDAVELAMELTKRAISKVGT